MKVYKTRKGSGFINNMIDKIPFEMHVPGYRYCGPGTKLAKRMAEKQKGVNQLDEACKYHDMCYEYKDDGIRKKADKTLEKAAWKRYNAADSKLGERITAAAVGTAMKLKQIGGKLKKNKIEKRGTMPNKKNNGFKDIVRAIKTNKSFTEENDLHRSSQLAIKTAKLAVKKYGDAKNIRKNIPRIIPIPKIGGLLPLIPIFAGLSALGALTGGASAVANAVLNTRNATKKYEEEKRHNGIMESIALGSKSGKGLHLRPYNNGFGLFLQTTKN